MHDRNTTGRSDIRQGKLPRTDMRSGVSTSPGKPDRQFGTECETALLNDLSMSGPHRPLVNYCTGVVVACRPPVNLFGDGSAATCERGRFCAISQAEFRENVCDVVLDGSTAQV